MKIKNKSIKEPKKNIDFRYNFKAYWEIMRNYKGNMLLIVILLLFGSALDLLDNYLFKAIVDSGANFFAGSISKEIFVKALGVIAVLFCFFHLSRWIFNWFQHAKINKLETQTIFDLKRKYFNHIIGLSHSFYSSHKTGSLISRFVRGGNALERMTDVFVFNAIPLVFQLCLAIVSMSYFNLTIGMIIVFTVIVFVLFSFIMQRIQESSNIEANRREDIEKANISDIFTNIDSIKYFGKEYYIKKKFLNISKKTREAFLKNWNYYRLISTGQLIILGIGTFFLIYYSILDVLSGEMTLGTLTFIYSVYGRLLGPLYGFVYGIRGFYRAMADFQDLFEYGKIESDIKDKPHAKNLEIKYGTIEFKNVNFYYSKRKILNNFSLEIDKNQKVAIVGHSGSGKTTLIN